MGLDERPKRDPNAGKNQITRSEWSSNGVRFGVRKGMTEAPAEHEAGKSCSLTVMAWPLSGRNPYVRILYAALERRGCTVVPLAGGPLRAILARVDVFHFHWISALLRQNWLVSGVRSVAFIGFLLILRTRGVRTVWTLHNTESYTHARHHPRLERVLATILHRVVDGFVVHSRYQLESLAEGVRRRTRYIPHHSYEPVLADAAPPGSGYEHRNVVYFGRIAPYKGLERAITAFQQLPENVRKRESLELLGAPIAESSDYIDEVRRLIQRKPEGIRAAFEYIGDETLELHVKRARAVVLPYTAVTNSGSLVYALSTRRPVITPANKLTAEILELYPELRDVVLTFDDDRELARCLEDVFTGRTIGSTASYDRFLRESSVDSIAESTIALFQGQP